MDGVDGEVNPVQHPNVIGSRVRNDNAAFIEDRFRVRQDSGVWLRAVLRQDVLVRDAEPEALGRRAVRDVGWVGDESVVDDLAVDVDDAEAADAAAAFAGFLDQFDAFAVDSDGGAGRDEGELGGGLQGAAAVVFDAAGAGLGRGLGVLVGWLLGGGGGVGVGIGLWRDYWAAVDPGDLVCGDCRDRHDGFVFD